MTILTTFECRLKIADFNIQCRQVQPLRKALGREFTISKKFGSDREWKGVLTANICRDAIVTFFLLLPFPALCQYGRGTCTDTMKQKNKASLFLGLLILAFIHVLAVVTMEVTFAVLLWGSSGLRSKFIFMVLRQM